MPIPFEPVCVAFLAEVKNMDNLTQSDPRMALQLLDVRLGLEQLLDDPDFRAELTARWADPDPSSIELGPIESFELFRKVSGRHAALTVEQVKLATTAIVDYPEFHMEALARWVRYDANPWPTHEQDLAGFDDAA